MTIPKTFGSNMPFGFNLRLSLLRYDYLEFQRCARNKRQTKGYKDKARAFREGRVCYCCGIKTNLCVHHKSNNEYEDISEDNCVVLCKGCHKIAHNGRPLIWIQEYYKSHPKVVT